MTDLATFPDAETALIALLADLATTGVETPADPNGTLEWLPFLRITCFGGGDNFVTDLSRIDVDAFASTRRAARDLAEAARQRLIGKPHLVEITETVPDPFDLNRLVTQTVTSLLDRVVTDTKPHYVPWTTTPPPHRYTAAYTTSARR